MTTGSGNPALSRIARAKAAYIGGDFSPSRTRIGKSKRRRSASLVRGTPQQVRQEVIRAVRHCAVDGGFILGASHSVVNATRPENYQAMLEAWRDCR